VGELEVEFFCLVGVVCFWYYFVVDEVACGFGDQLLFVGEVDYVVALEFIVSVIVFANVFCVLIVCGLFFRVMLLIVEIGWILRMVEVRNVFLVFSRLFILYLFLVICSSLIIVRWVSELRILVCRVGVCSLFFEI